MAEKLIVADTSILIDYFRKTDKTNAALITLYDLGYDFVISVITYYEIYSGATTIQLPFWKSFLARTAVLPLNETVAEVAVEINNGLKYKSKQIAMADLFIAATAMANELPLSTLNKKHFERIEGLLLV